MASLILIILKPSHPDCVEELFLHKIPAVVDAWGFAQLLPMATLTHHLHCHKFLLNGTKFSLRVTQHLPLSPNLPLAVSKTDFHLSTAHEPDSAFPLLKYVFYISSAAAPHTWKLFPAQGTQLLSFKPCWEIFLWLLPVSKMTFC